MGFVFEGTCGVDIEFNALLFEVIGEVESVTFKDDIVVFCNVIFVSQQHGFVCIKTQLEFCRFLSQSGEVVDYDSFDGCVEGDSRLEDENP